MTLKRFVIFALPLSMLSLLLCGGCPQTPSTQTGGSGGPLTKFSSADEMLKYFRDRADAQSSSNAFYERSTLALAPAAPAPSGTSVGAEDSAGSDNSSGGATGGSFSTTNLQEEGVDESDVLKSDGTNFYVARGSTVRIIRAQPADQLAEIARVTVEGPVDSIYLDGANLIVLSAEYGPADARIMMPEIWPPFYYGSTTVVTNVDVTDPAAPVVKAQTKLDGSLVSSRIVAGKLVLVLTYMPQFPTATPLFGSSFALKDVLPNRIVDGTSNTIVAPTDVYYPQYPDGSAMSLVITLDAADVRNQLASIGVLGDVGTIYASTQAVYVTDDAYDAANNYRAHTDIHKFAFDANGVAQYTASGEVAGRLLNQFSLGEYDGRLRVATHIDPSYMFIAEDGVGTGSVGSGTTTTAPQSAEANNASTAPPEDSNSVYVLEPSGAALNVVGKIENIQPGEKLYSARFIGTAGYLVTFKQIDPLFVINLTDPTNPTITGELKIPGYSDYLHPLADGKLIGVGQATGTSRWGGQVRAGVQLSLFDASDPANPTLTQQVTLGGQGSFSDVSQTAKAFTFVDHNGELLIGIPVQLWDYSNTDYYVYDPLFEGVVYYRVDPAAGFTELGRVAAIKQNADQWWTWSAWRRGAFINDNVYSVTPDGVRSAPLSDFNATHDVAIEPTEDEKNGGGIGYPVDDTIPL